MLKQKTTQQPDPEALLMTQFSKGDMEAFEVLVNRCQGGLIQFFTMLSGNRADGEELAQEVFIKLYRCRQNYRATAKFKTYLYRVARNLWTDHLRRKSSRGNLISLEALDASGQGLTQGAEKQPQVTMRGEDRELYKAIGRLSQDQREVLLMSQIEDLTYREIAEIQSIPVGTVKTRMYHAVRKLQSILKRG